MKKILIAAAVILVLTGCASQKEFVKSPAVISQCINQADTKAADFYGETASNLNALQSGNALVVTFDVKTMCNSNLDYEVQKTDQTVKIKIKNSEVKKVDCTCTKTMTLHINDLLEEGTYNVLVTNETGYQLLTQKAGVVFKKQ